METITRTTCRLCGSSRLQGVIKEHAVLKQQIKRKGIVFGEIYEATAIKNKDLHGG
jgi:hypothetical protein